jgi:hypothetical protein
MIMAKKKPQPATEGPKEAKRGKICPQCEKKVANRIPACPFCGHKFPAPAEKKTPTQKHVYSPTVKHVYDPPTAEHFLTFLDLARDKVKKAGDLKAVEAAIAAHDKLVEVFGSVKDARDIAELIKKIG